MGMFQLPRDFSAAGIAAGIKSGGVHDMALLVSGRDAAAAGVFTTNRMYAAPVRLCRERLQTHAPVRAVLVNSGNANACTGEQGYQDAVTLTGLAAETLGVPTSSVLMCSTGTIGRRLPLPTLSAGIKALAGNLSTEGGSDAARAIMTTDTRPKTASRSVNLGGTEVLLCGLAKGAGMIEPTMATMLCFLMTDAQATAADLQAALASAVQKSFNCISVDGDMSTNDTVLLLANGASGSSAALVPGSPGWDAFQEALDAVCLELALAMVDDGEGATKRVTVQVTGAATPEDAERAARAVANSLLVKTSWAGKRAQWGRVMDALGYCGVPVGQDKIDIYYDEWPAALGGLAAETPAETLNAVVAARAFTLTIRLGAGEATARVYACDCTEAYVRINV